MRPHDSDFYFTISLSSNDFFYLVVSTFYLIVRTFYLVILLFQF